MWPLRSVTSFGSLLLFSIGLTFSFILTDISIGYTRKYIFWATLDNLRLFVQTVSTSYVPVKFLDNTKIYRCCLFSFTFKFCVKCLWTCACKHSRNKQYHFWTFVGFVGSYSFIYLFNIYTYYFRISRYFPLLHDHTMLCLLEFFIMHLLFWSTFSGVKRIL